MLEEQLLIECDFDEDVQTLGSMLKCAGNLNQFDVVERVWKWSQPMRKHRLGGSGGKDCDVALSYTQFVTVCSKHGRVDKVLEVWNEWCQSTIGANNNTLHSEVFRGAVMTVLSTDPATVSEACNMLEKQLLIECEFEGDVQTLGSMLKCAGNLNRFDLAERVWKWSQPIRKHRLDGSGGMDCDVALVYTQFVTLCGQNGHVDKVLEVWNEWCQSTIGRRDNTLHSEVFRGGVISALAMNGRADVAEKVFNIRSLTDQNKRNHALVTAHCSFHMQDFTKEQFHCSIVLKFEQVLSVRVYTAVIDACARVGEFGLALEIVDRMRNQNVIPNEVTWMTLLGPCRAHINISVAEFAFQELQKVQDLEDQTAAFVVLADVYKAAELHDKAEEIQNKRRSLGLHKKQGTVEVTVKGQQHTFYVGEIPTELQHASKTIHSKLDGWKRNLVACGVSTTSVTCQHSEKLALAFAVVSGQKDITLTKNLANLFSLSQRFSHTHKN